MVRLTTTLRFGWIAGLLLATSACRTMPERREPENLADAKAAVAAYHESGDYLEDVAAVAAEAEQWLVERAGRRGPQERLAVVFDVDETVLSNYPEMRSQDFGYTSASWRAWVERAEAPALAPVRDVYRTARRLGLDVFFLTGRSEPEGRAATARNLAREGMGEYTRLLMTAAADRALPAAQRKAAARAALEAEGYTIIASIGDQLSDLAGGHAERTFKVPNPFYFVP